MTEDYEVIEIGEDGAFDIPTPSKSKQQIVEEIDYHSAEWQQKVAQEDNRELLEALQPGDFSLYQSDNSFWIIFRLPENDELDQLLLEDNNEFVIKTKAGESFKSNIDSGIKVDRDSIRCKCWKDYVTLTFSSV